MLLFTQWFLWSLFSSLFLINERLSTVIMTVLEPLVSFLIVHGVTSGDSNIFQLA